MMYLFKIATLVLTLTLGLPVAANNLNPDRVRMPMATEHVNSAPASNLNETNPGLALTWEGRGIDFTAGVVKNSFGNTAPFLTVSRDWWSNDTCAVASFLGTAHYPELQGKTSYQYQGWIPIGGMHVECGSVFLQAMPGRGLVGSASGKSHADAILVFGVTFDLGD